MSRFKRAKDSKDKEKVDNFETEKGDNKIHIQRQQAKYGEIHSEFKYFMKSTEQQNYFSNQIQNYKQVLDSVIYETHKKQDQLSCMKKQLSEIKYSGNQFDSTQNINDETQYKMQYQLLKESNKDHNYSTRYTCQDNEENGSQTERIMNSTPSLNSQIIRRNSTASITMDNMKFKRFEHSNNSFYSTASHTLLHQTQIQAINIKTQLKSVELNLEQLNEKIILEEQTTEILNRRHNEILDSSDKVRVEINLLQDVIRQYVFKENKVTTQHTNFFQDESAITRELKRAKYFVDKETEFQQNQVQEKINLFQAQNKIIKDSVRHIKNLRNQIKEQEKLKIKQLNKIDKLEDERLKKEITKKDSELFVKNIEEIDLILKYFIYGNPQDLHWERIDLNTKNYDNLFPSQTNLEQKEEASPICQFQRINSFNPQIKDSLNLDNQQLHRQSQTFAFPKFPNRDQILRSSSQKRSYLSQGSNQFSPKVYQNQIVDKVNKFINYHKLTPEQIFDKLMNNYHQMILTEVTLKNRLSNLMGERENLFIHIKFLDEKLELERKNSNQLQFLSLYEEKAQIFIQNNENCIQLDEDTMNQIIQKEEQAKIPELQLLCFKQSEKFSSFIFYSLNEMVFRWSSFLCSIYNLSSKQYKEESKLFFEQQKQRKEFSKKIQNLVKFHQNSNNAKLEEENKIESNQNLMNEDNTVKSKQSLDNIDKKQQEEEKEKNNQLNIIFILQSFQKESAEQHNEIIPDEEIKVIYTYLRNDFVLNNFLGDQVLKDFLSNSFEEYKKNKDQHPNNPFEKFSSYCLDNIHKLKNITDQYFKSSLSFIIETLLLLMKDTFNEQEYIKQIIDNQNAEEMRNQLDQSQRIFSINSEQIVSFHETVTNPININENTINANVSTSSKKSFRRRVIMMKCREFNDYFGFEVHRKNNVSTAAQTIVDVIYETIYDMKHGNSTEIFDVNQELNFFKQNRNYSKNIEKEEASLVKEENQKREEEKREKEKSNKTYLMKSHQLEFNEKENKLIAQIDKQYNEKIKENAACSLSNSISNQKDRFRIISEKEKGHRRSQTIQKMRETYSNFKTKHIQILPLQGSKDSDSTLSQSQLNFLAPQHSKKNIQYPQQKVHFSRSSSFQYSSQKISDYMSNTNIKDNRNAQISDRLIKVPSISLDKVSVTHSHHKQGKKSLFQQPKKQRKSVIDNNEDNEKDYPHTDRVYPSQRQNENKSEYKENKLRLNNVILRESSSVTDYNEETNKIISLQNKILKNEEEITKQQSEDEKISAKQNEIKPHSIKLKKLSFNKIEEVKKYENNKILTQLGQPENKIISNDKNIQKLKDIKTNKNICHLLMRRSFDKVIKIPQPLAPTINQNQSQSLKQKNLGTKSHHNSIKKSNQSPNKKEKCLIQNQTFLNQQYSHNIFVNPYDCFSESHIYGDQFAQRSAYLISRQFLSTNLPSNLLGSNNYYL